ncbi:MULTISPECIES: tetratricopeptide repeat protein [Aquimarina]|uniref:tetratricopeptide repeat protein n=1 Tax=Aquimarina TaxID=290174 RepID=UPI000945C8D9|nr:MULTISPECIES: tetratricopeptide repeat protein [Aquimarina]
MKNILLFSFIILVYCKSDKQDNFLENHDHSKHINQKIKNEKATEFYHKGTKLFEQRNLDSAKIYLNKSLEIEKNSIVIDELGTIALTEKKYQEAISYFDDSIKQDLNYWPSHINKSRVFILANHFDSAEKTLRNMLLKCESEYWRAYANLYLTYIYTNGVLDCEKARESSKKSVFIKNDMKLKNQYESIIKGVKKDCS